MTKINGSKKKTPTSHRTCHPTFNNLIEYHEIDLNLVQAVHISGFGFKLISDRLQISIYSMSHSV